MMIMLMITMMFSGCATAEQIAKNLENKSISGDGLITKNKIGFNETDKIPEVEAIFISGDFQSVVMGKNFFSFKKKSSALWYNASNKTSTSTLIITASDNSKFEDVLKYAIELIKLQNEDKLTEDKE